MKKWQIVLAIALIAVTQGLTVYGQGEPPLRLLKFASLPGLEGQDFDHFNYDLTANRLYLAAEANKSVEVFNLRTGEHLRSMGGFVSPHAIIIPPNSDKIFVTDEDRGKMGLIRSVSKDTGKIINNIELPIGADVKAFDPVTNYGYVRGRSPKGAKTIQVAIIDTKDFKHIGDIFFPGDRLEGMAVEVTGKRRLFVGLTGTREVGAADLNTREVVARWSVPEATPDTIVQAIALDEADHRLFVACRKPGNLLVFNTDTGEVVARYPGPSVMDDLDWDAARKRIYIPGGPATSVFQQLDPDHYEHIADIPTGTEGQEGKTALFVPQLGLYYVALSGEVKPKAKVGVKIFKAVR